MDKKNNGGDWIRLYRSLVKWEWYEDVNTRVVFLHLLLTANWEPTRWRGVEMQKGQRVFGLQKLAKECGVSIRSLRTVLERLKSTNEIDVTTTPHFSLVTIKKWEEYQYEYDANDKQTTNKRQTNDNSIRIKELKNIRINNTPLTPQGEDEPRLGDVCLQDFERFWTAYPRRIAKKNALASWRRLKPDQQTVQRILDHIEASRQDIGWRKDGGRFIPHPTTYLNQARWEEEVDAPKISNVIDLGPLPE